MSITKRYLTKFDEINKLFSEISFEDKTIDEFIDYCEDHLLDAYEEGYAYAGYVLGDKTDRAYDIRKADKSISKVVGGKTTEERLTEYYNQKDIYPTETINNIKRVMDTEYHRIFNDGSVDRAIVSGATTKTWITVKDDRVRDTHSFLEDTTVGVEDYFVTYDGDQALCPGGFESAENNVNCRCILKFK